MLPHKSILAIGAVIDVALHSVEEPVTARDLAHRLQLPRRYLEPVLQALVREGILAGMRGVRGGYKLAKAPAAISVYDISEAVSEETSEEFFGLLRAVVLPALTPAEHRFESALRRITVEDLVHFANVQMTAKEPYRRTEIFGPDLERIFHSWNVPTSR
jgi:Rrf2 family protein